MCGNVQRNGKRAEDADIDEDFDVQQTPEENLPGRHRENKGKGAGYGQVLERGERI